MTNSVVDAVLNPVITGKNQKEWVFSLNFGVYMLKLFLEILHMYAMHAVLARFLSTDRN